MAKKSGALVFKAGEAAYAAIRAHGFCPSQVGTLMGASGGAKWLVLSHIDRVLSRRLLPAVTAPVFLLGSSIGAWRFACYAQKDPEAAITRFEELYVQQTYSEKPDSAEITSKSRVILDRVLGPRGVDEILANPNLRLNVLTVRSRHLLGSERRYLLGAGLLAAMLANAVNRSALRAFFSRALFFDSRDVPPFHGMGDFPIDRVPLSATNLADAILASGAIPLVLDGVRNIAGAPTGTYRDGGIIDYHLDLPAAPHGKLALFPHFFDWFKPGWFDKRLAWRQVSPANFAHTLVICPSAEFVASLPGGKVPDRTDFARLPTAERIQRWRTVIQRCRALGDELEQALERQDVASRVEPL